LKDEAADMELVANAMPVTDGHDAAPLPLVVEVEEAVGMESVADLIYLQFMDRVEFSFPNQKLLHIEALRTVCSGCYHAGIYIFYSI